MCTCALSLDHLSGQVPSVVKSQRPIEKNTQDTTLETATSADSQDTALDNTPSADSEEVTFDATPADNRDAASNTTPVDGQDIAFDTTPPVIPLTVLVPGTIPPAIPPTVSVHVPAPYVTPPILPLVPVLAAVRPPLPQPGNIWLAAPYLVVGKDGQLKQSAQSPEINKVISKTVQLANLKVLFVDAFPDLEKQNDWLSQPLVTILKDQARVD